MSAFDDLLAAQLEMPTLQKTGLNPHFNNRFVPLEELLTTVVPILNKHNFVLMQLPSISLAGEPALTCELIHASGERFGAQMLLMAPKVSPQDQGSAITYARRYSLMAMLGLNADVDDDAETAQKPHTNGHTPIRGGVERPVPASAQPTKRAPICPLHKQEMNFVRAGTSKKTGKPYPAFYACPDRECKRSINLADWEMQQEQMSQPSEPMLEPDAIPFE